MGSNSPESRTCKAVALSSPVSWARCLVLQGRRRGITRLDIESSTPSSTPPFPPTYHRYRANPRHCAAQSHCSLTVAVRWALLTDADFQTPRNFSLSDESAPCLCSTSTCLSSPSCRHQSMRPVSHARIASRSATMRIVWWVLGMWALALHRRGPTARPRSYPVGTHRLTPAGT